MSGMRIDSRFLNWGVFFILLGAIPLAVQQGWIPDDAVSGWWRFWPLILIGIGVGLLLRRTAFHFLGGTLVAATCGLMFGSLVAGGVGGNIGFACDQNRPGTPFAGQSGTLSGNSSVELEMNCGDLVTTPNPGSGWTPAGSGPDGQVPRVDGRGDPAARSSRQTRLPQVARLGGRVLDGRAADRPDLGACPRPSTPGRRGSGSAGSSSTACR